MSVALLLTVLLNAKGGTYVTTLHRPIHLTLLLHRKHNLHVRPGRQRQQLHGLLHLHRTTRCACPLPPCTHLWRQGLQLLLPARDVGVFKFPSLEHFSLISEYSFSDDGRNSVLPPHSLPSLCCSCAWHTALRYPSSWPRSTTTTQRGRPRCQCDSTTMTAMRHDMMNST